MHLEPAFAILGQRGFVFGLFGGVVHAEEVHAKRGRQGRQRAIRAGIGGGDQPKDKDDARPGRQVAQRDAGVELVGCFGDVQPHAGGVDVEQGSEGQKKQVGENKHDAEGRHIFLRVPKCRHAQVLLHHVLVQTGHHDGDERTAEELLEEVVRVGPASLEVEHLAIVTAADQFYHARKVRLQRAADVKDRKPRRQQHTDGLKRIRINDRLDTAPKSIQPDQDDGNGDRTGERYAERAGHEFLQDDRYEIKAKGCADHP